MSSYKKALLFGILVWLIPFAISIPFYNREGVLLIDIYLFKSIMIVVGSLTGGMLLFRYFKRVKHSYLLEASMIGIGWLMICLILDGLLLKPMMELDWLSYFSQIGLRYLVIAIFSLTIGFILTSANAQVARDKVS